MYLIKSLLIAIFLILSITGFGKPKPAKLLLINKIALSIKEPSDICIVPNSNKYAVVSDNGLLYLTDTNGVVLQEATFKGFDFEGVFADDNNIYVSDERSRMIHVFNHNLDKLKSFQLIYYGGRNSGFESITFNKVKKCFVLITEKHPCIIFEFDTAFNELKQYSYSYSSDVSSATYYNNELYILSDEERKILILNPTDYSLISEIKLRDVNPEGIAILPNNTIIIVSDDGQYLSKYNIKPKQ